MKKFEVHVYFDVKEARGVRFEHFVYAENSADAHAAVRHAYQLDDSSGVYVWEVDQ